MNVDYQTLAFIPDNGQASQKKNTNQQYQRSQDVELPEVIDHAEVNFKEKDVSLNYSTRCKKLNGRTRT